MSRAPNNTKTLPTKTNQHASSIRPKSGRAVAFRLLGSLILLISAGAAGYFYMKYQDVKDNQSESAASSNQAETERVLSSLKENILITEADAPTVARIDDPEKLKTSNAEFYKDATKGDYLVVFPKRAIIYRQSNNQIINVAPIVDASKANPSNPAATTPANTDKN